MTDERISDLRGSNTIPEEPERISDDPGRPDDIILGAPG